MFENLFHWWGCGETGTHNASGSVNLHDPSGGNLAFKITNANILWSNRTTIKEFTFYILMHLWKALCLRYLSTITVTKQNKKIIYITRGLVKLWGFPTVKQHAAIKRGRFSMYCYDKLPKIKWKKKKKDIEYTKWPFV